MMNNKMKPAIVMQTDFSKDISTCTMEGVCMKVDPELQIFDSTHNIPNFSTYTASSSLAFIVGYWPEGTVFISVVDPGVGTDRRACVAKLKNGSYVVTPDNGSLTHMLRHPGIEMVREIDESVNRLPGSEGVNIFHGRDVFAYTAARLASGVITFEEVGKDYPVEEIIRHTIVEPEVNKNVITGMIDSIDYHFGLVASNIPMEVLETCGVKYGDVLHVTICNKKEVVYQANVPYVVSFGSVSVGEPLLMNSESKTIEIAMNSVNMTDSYHIECGPDWTITLVKEEV